MITLPELENQMDIACDLELNFDISYFNAEDLYGSDWVEFDSIEHSHVIVHDSITSITSLTKSKFVNASVTARLLDPATLDVWAKDSFDFTIMFEVLVFEDDRIEDEYEEDSNLETLVDCGNLSANVDDIGEQSSQGDVIEYAEGAEEDSTFTVSSFATALEVESGEQGFDDNEDE